VNVVMWEALELSKAIISGAEGDLNAKVRESEARLFDRAEASARRSERNLKVMMGSECVEDAVQGIIGELEAQFGKPALS
jgi:hypothetical protein